MAQEDRALHGHLPHQLDHEDQGDPLYPEDLGHHLDQVDPLDQVHRMDQGDQPHLVLPCLHQDLVVQADLAIPSILCVP